MTDKEYLILAKRMLTSQLQEELKPTVRLLTAGEITFDEFQKKQSEKKSELISNIVDFAAGMKTIDDYVRQFKNGFYWAKFNQAKNEDPEVVFVTRSSDKSGRPIASIITMFSDFDREYSMDDFNFGDNPQPIEMPEWVKDKL